MDSQHHKKNQTSGHESHGVHLCNKCGWPFPNPHPSARHRRAHRKICGTIENYKMIDSQGSLSDDEHASDEDIRTPSPKMLERSVNEKGSGVIGERSSRSEDEVFADAVAEFPDGGASNIANEVIVEKVKQLGRLTTIESFKDAESFDTFPLPEVSTENNRMQNIEASEIILSNDEQDSQDHVIMNSTLGVDALASAEGQIKESAYDPSDAKRESDCNMSPAKAATKTDAEKSSINSTDVCNFRQVDAKGDEEIISARNELDPAVPSSDHSFTELGKVEAVTSETASAPNPKSGDAGFQFKEVQHNVDSTIPSHDIFPDIGTVEVTDGAFVAVENRENAFPGSASDFSGQVNNVKGEGNSNVHEFSVSDAIPSVDDSEIMIKGSKDLVEGKLPQYINADAVEVIDSIKDSHAKDASSISQSELCDDAPSVSVSDRYDSEGYLERNSLRSNDEPIATGVFSSVSHGSEGYLDQKRRRSNAVEVFPSQGEVFNEKKLEEIGSSADSTAVGTEPRDIVGFPEESVSHACNKDSYFTASLSQDAQVLPDANSVGSPIGAAIGQANNVVGIESTTKIDEAKTERIDAADHHEKERVTVDEDMNSDLSISSENEVNARVDVRAEDNHVVDGENGQAERNNTSTKATVETDFGTKLLEENCAGKEKTAPESAGNNQDLRNFSENDIYVLENLTESKYTHVVSVSGTRLDHIESGGNKYVHLERVGVNEGAPAENPRDVSDESCEVSADAMLPQIKTKETEFTLSDGIVNTKEGLNNLVVDGTDKVNVESVEAAIKSNLEVKAVLPDNSKKDEDLNARELISSPLDMVSSVQSCGTIDHSLDKEFAKASSADKPQPLLDENDSAQQHTLSVTDLSVDSSSQNSVEGHWGSVSDIPAIVDAESLPSNGLQVPADREKGISNKQKAESEAPHSDKADMFEPPSFMTLVEPKPAKLSASEVENPHQSSQTGWFPSLTHVANDSQGRKKNEEVIAKVTKWSTEKQHAPLKNLLGEAKVGKSPNVKENESIQKENGSSVTTVSSILGPQEDKDRGGEWNSPARYPADIKTEKRKVKGRPYWAQFVCCSSVN